ncbi:hypothetical protein CVT26_000591, partial [Gymnopilus dilepis]
GAGPALTSAVRASTPAPDADGEDDDDSESRPSKMRRRRSLAKVDEMEEGNSSAPQESTPTPTPIQNESQEQTLNGPTTSVQQQSFGEKFAPMSASIHAPTLTASEEQLVCAIILVASVDGPTTSVQQPSFEKFAPMSASIHAPTRTVPEEPLLNGPTPSVQQQSFREKFAPMSASIHAPTPTVPEEELVETPAPAVAAAATPQDVVITPELCEQELTDEGEEPVPTPSTPCPPTVVYPRAVPPLVCLLVIISRNAAVNHPMSFL